MHNDRATHTLHLQVKGNFPEHDGQYNTAYRLIDKIEGSTMFRDVVEDKDAYQEEFKESEEETRGQPAAITDDEILEAADDWMSITALHKKLDERGNYNTLKEMVWALKREGKMAAKHIGKNPQGGKLWHVMSVTNTSVKYSESLGGQGGGDTELKYKNNTCTPPDAWDEADEREGWTQ